jgi:hypothetical protein
LRDSLLHAVRRRHRPALLWQRGSCRLHGLVQQLQGDAFEGSVATQQQQWRVGWMKRRTHTRRARSPRAALCVHALTLLGVGVKGGLAQRHEVSLVD